MQVKMSPLYSLTVLLQGCVLSVLEATYSNHERPEKTQQIQK